MSVAEHHCRSIGFQVGLLAATPIKENYLLNKKILHVYWVYFFYQLCSLSFRIIIWQYNHLPEMHKKAPSSNLLQTVSRSEHRITKFIISLVMVDPQFGSQQGKKNYNPNKMTISPWEHKMILSTLHCQFTTSEFWWSPNYHSASIWHLQFRNLHLWHCGSTFSKGQTKAQQSIKYSFSRSNTFKSI